MYQEGFDLAINSPNDDSFEMRNFDFPFFPINDYSISISTSILPKNESMNFIGNHLKSSYNIEQNRIDSKESKKDLPEFYPINKILDEYIKSIDINIVNEAKSIIYLDKYKFIELTNRRGIKKSICIIIENDDVQHKKRGREKKTEKIIATHDKMSIDNILKKIKSNLINDYLLKFINAMLKKENCKLIKLDHKYIKNMKKTEELKYLKMTLKELFSLNISDKYNKYSVDYNAQKIDEIIDKDEVLGFIFNLTYNDFIELFTHKKKIEDMISNTKIGNNIYFEEIKRLIPKVEDFYIKLLKKNDIKYSSLVIFYLFNLERALKLKQDRRKKEKNEFLDIF